MTRWKKDLLRTLTEEERNMLERISRSHREPAVGRDGITPVMCHFAGCVSDASPLVITPSTF